MQTKTSQNAIIKIIERLKEALGANTDTELAKALAVRQNTVSSWKTRGTIDYALIIAKCDGIDLNWIFSDKRTTSHNAIRSTLKDEQSKETTAIKAKGKKGIPLIPIEAVAGVMSDNNMQVMEHECEYFHVPLFKNADFLMQVTGDSMQPKYYSGDIVACRKVFVGTFFQWNRVYVIDTNQGVVIKRVHEGKDSEHIRLVSENLDYKPFEISLSDIYSIAIVIGVVRAE